MPDPHNAGDFGTALVGASHEYALTADQPEACSDGHMDVDVVCPGAPLLDPVKVPGAGIDMHALQGDGEIAGHTMEVSGSLTLQVEVVKSPTLEGPVRFPPAEDPLPLARSFTHDEKARTRALAGEWGLADVGESAPILPAPFNNVASWAWRR